MKNLLGLALMIVLFVGCSKMEKLGGKVTFSDDGSPLTTGTVMFQKENYQARGELGPDGTYTVGSFKANDGLPRGTYQVFVVGAYKGGEANSKGMPTDQPLIADKFYGPESGITFEVDGKQKSFDFKVDRPVTQNKK